MATTVTGGCRCGQLRYRFEQEGPLLNYCCHCLDCQKSTASAFADQLIVSTDALTIEGRAITFSTQRPSGGTTTNQHCPDCFSRVCNANDVYPAMTIVRAGTLDDPSGLDPFAHMWIKRKRGWIIIADDVPAFDEGPDPMEFMRLAMERRKG
ncbi:GFA family protein [Sphingopyxis sp.]|uniref:GFA family protein n=1 Tax=Sphingopyxis sp. TaxID=1908224 RepID=UPI003BAB74FF